MKQIDRQWWREPAINRRAWSWHDAHDNKHQGEWWQNAVIYQITPCIYQDSTGTGSGDLEGIIQRLDYISALGVDAIWLTPIYKSPLHDLGYDISDMQSIHPNLGTMDDFKRLVKLVHQTGLRIILDMVWSHTSDQHPWFLESKKNKTNPKADWYVWADPAENGGPPNNWLSAFNGQSGWKYSEERNQYYYANFLESQPDLNWHNTEVRDEVLRQARFWLDLDVDGMRLDAVNFYCHDADMQDNPLRDETHVIPQGIDPRNPLAKQLFTNSFCRAETFEFLKPLRQLVNEYPGVFLLGEVTLCDDSIKEAALYVSGKERLHAAYNSGLLFKEKINAPQLRKIIQHAVECFSEGGTCWIVGNHDYGRLRSRWDGIENPYPAEFYPMAVALLLSLPGGLCLWQGDELGLSEARIPEDIPVEKMRDPFGKLMYPLLNGRDGSRTPMPWDDALKNYGFTSADESWLPFPESNKMLSVARQQRDPNSLLSTWRSLLHWRKNQPALLAGTTTMLDSGKSILGFIREYSEQILLCVFNLSEEKEIFSMQEYEYYKPIIGLGFQHQIMENGDIQLPAWGSFFADLRSSSEMQKFK
ncbi:MAG: alpha-amylase family glycosyl hydrolase [Pseudomonadota bacterium]